MTTPPFRAGAAVLVGFIGLFLAIFYLLVVSLPYDFDPTVFLAVGEDSTAIRAYTEELLGEVATRGGLGHDGKYYFAIANDPLFLNPEVHASVLDRAIYRGQRILFPAIAGGLGLFPPRIVVWSMVFVNVLAVGGGTYLTSRIGLAIGASPWVGLVFPFNLGIVSELDIGGGGVLAMCLACGAVLALEHEQQLLAAFLLAAASLAREVMVAFALGIWVLFLLRRQPRWRLLLIPAAVVAAWHLYIRWRLAALPHSDDVRELAQVPFEGLIAVVRSGGLDSTTGLVVWALVVVALAFAVKAVRSRLVIAWAALPFAVLLFVWSVKVWAEPYDLARALTPVLTAYPVLIFASRARTEEHTFD